MLSRRGPSPIRSGRAVVVPGTPAARHTAPRGAPAARRVATSADARPHDPTVRAPPDGRGSAYSWAMLTVGLTGGIGSGKSTVARVLAERGAVVVDADRVAREREAERHQAGAPFGAWRVVWRLLIPTAAA